MGKNGYIGTGKKQSSYIPDRDEKALDILKELQAVRANGGASHALENEFVKLYITLAELAANRQEHNVKNTPYAVRLDFNELFSAAMEGLRQVAESNKVSVNVAPATIRNLCIATINRRIIDRVRGVMGRSDKAKKSSLPPLPIDGTIQETVAETRLPSEDFEYEDLNRHMKEQLKEVLGDRQYECMCAVIDYLPQGYSSKEIADKINMSPGVLFATVSSVRKKLHEKYPELEKELKALAYSDHVAITR